MEECKFKGTEDKPGCHGGHTTAQHHMDVHERLIKDVCGQDAYYDIKIAVDREARMTTTLMVAFVGTVMAQTGCDKATAVRRVAELCAVTETALAKGGKG